MTHKHKVVRLDPAVVEGMMVDMAEHRTGPDTPHVPTIHPRHIVDVFGQSSHLCEGSLRLV